MISATYISARRLHTSDRHEHNPSNAELLQAIIHAVITDWGTRILNGVTLMRKISQLLKKNKKTVRKPPVFFLKKNRQKIFRPAPPFLKDATHESELLWPEVCDNQPTLYDQRHGD
jgi:hypothetical protein